MPSGEKTGKLTRLEITYLKFAMHKKPGVQLAKELNISPSTISRYRSGEIKGK